MNVNYCFPHTSGQSWPLRELSTGDDISKKWDSKHGAGAQVSNRSGVLLLIAFVLLYGIPFARAADPQPYKVDMASTGDSALNSTLKATSELETLRKTAPVGPFGLIGRARGDLERLKTVLDSFGYYQSYVEIRIDGLPLDDPGVGEELTSRSKDNDARNQDHIQHRPAIPPA